MRQGCLIWVGKEGRKDPEALICDRYLQRIKRYAGMEVKVLKPYQSKDEGETHRREDARILERIDAADYVILCDEGGKELTSQGLASLLDAPEPAAARRIIWMIGGAMGVSDATRQRADFVLSLSRMTLPHALARVVLLEQIYRALSIRAGHPYHHEGGS